MIHPEAYSSVLMALLGGLGLLAMLSWDLWNYMRSRPGKGSTEGPPT